MDQLAASGLVTDDPSGETPVSEANGEQSALTMSPGPTYTAASGAEPTGDVGAANGPDEALRPQPLPSKAGNADGERDGALHTSGRSLGQSMGRNGGASGDSWRDGDGGANADAVGSSGDQSHHVEITPVQNVDEAMLHLLDRPTSERNRCFGRKRFIRLEKMRALVYTLYTRKISALSYSTV